LKSKVYIETSIVSYLVARPSRDVVQAAAQKLTQAWWEDRGRFTLFASDLVLREAAAGDAKAAARRLEILAPITLVRVNAEAANLADGLLRAGGLPQRAGADALHIAVAAAHGLDYLLTWNCKHIASASLRGKIEAVCRAAGFEPPVICTPQELIRER